MPTPGWQLQKKWRCAFVPFVFVCVPYILCSGMWNIDLKKKKKKSDLPTLFFFLCYANQTISFFRPLIVLTIREMGQSQIHKIPEPAPLLFRYGAQIGGLPFFPVIKMNIVHHVCVRHLHLLGSEREDKNTPKTLHDTQRSWTHLSAKTWRPPIWAPWLMTPLHVEVYEVWDLPVYLWGQSTFWELETSKTGTVGRYVWYRTQPISTLRGYCTPGPYFWRLCVISWKIKQFWTQYPIDLLRNVQRNSNITGFLQ